MFAEDMWTASESFLSRSWAPNSPRAVAVVAANAMVAAVTGAYTGEKHIRLPYKPTETCFLDNVTAKFVIFMSDSAYKMSGTWVMMGKTPAKKYIESACMTSCPHHS